MKKMTKLKASKTENVFGNDDDDEKAAAEIGNIFWDETRDFET